MSLGGSLLVALQDAPVNDLLLHASLDAHSDHIVSRSDMTSLSRHSWYLTEELVLLALFSEKVTADEKSSMVEKLRPARTFTNRHGTSYGKPILPKLKSGSLSNYVGSSSWHFFNVLDISTEFLELPPDDWGKCESYIHAKQRVSSLKVVNDCAERGVKLASDFYETSRCEMKFQNTLQVVERNRMLVPNQRKRKASGQVS